MEKALDITLDELLNKLGKTKEDLVMSLNNLQQYVEFITANVLFKRRF